MTRVADAIAETLLGPGGAVAPPPLLLGAPTLERHGDDFGMRWNEYRVDLSVTGLRENSDGLHAEVAVAVAGAEIHWGRLNLVSTSAREGVVKKLAAIAADIPWRTMLERACRMTTMAIRQGSPTVTLTPRQAAGPRVLIHPLLPLNAISVLFGDGGAGKGYTAVALALAATHGMDLPGMRRPEKLTKALYLDWESTAADLEERVYLVAKGLKCSGEGLHYRRINRALADEAQTLRAEVSRLGAGFLIVDSLAPACGPEPEGADALVRTYNAIRSFGNVTTLVIAHMSKMAADQRNGAARPFGSVFVWNLARSVWELRRSGDTTTADLVVALYHRKVNHGRVHEPLGLRFTFGANAVTMAGDSIQDAPDLLKRMSVAEGIRSVLKEGGMTTEEIAEALDQDEDTVGRTLRRLAGAKVPSVIKLQADIRTGRARWGLPV